MSTSKNNQLPSEIPDDISEVILDDEQHHNSSNSSELEETLYPSNQEDGKELNDENNNSELSKKSTSMDDNKKEEKKNESKNLLGGNNIKRSDNNGISSQKKLNKIKKNLSSSLKNYLKKLLKKKISRKNFKILIKKKKIIHKLLEIVKKYKNKKKYRGFLKDILKRSIWKLLKNYINCKNPKTKLESGNINLNINNLNYYSDSLDFWINQSYEKNDEILSLKDASKIGDISCNKGIYNIMDNEEFYITEDALYIHFQVLNNLPNTNYTTV